jgi:hypothetical protein
LPVLKAIPRVMRGIDRIRLSKETIDGYVIL